MPGRRGKSATGSGGSSRSSASAVAAAAAASSLALAAPPAATCSPANTSSHSLVNMNANSLVNISTSTAANSPVTSSSTPTAIPVPRNPPTLIVDSADPPCIPFDASKLAGFVSTLRGSDESRHEWALRSIRKLTCAEKSPPLAQVLASGVLPSVLRCLDHPREVMQFEAAWLLTNLASGSTAQARMLAPALPRLVELLSAPHPDLQEQVVWCLGNYAGSSCSMRDELLAIGVLPPLLDLMNRPAAPLPVLRVGSWALSNLARGKPQPDFAALAPALPTLARLLSEQTDSDVLTDTLWAVSYLSDDSSTSYSARLDALIRTPGLLGALVPYLRDERSELQSPALRIVGNIASGDDVQTQALLDADVLPSLLALLVSPKKSIRKEACWAVSNVTAGAHAHIQAVMDAGIVPELMRIVMHEEARLQKEACWALANITSNGTQAQTLALVGPLCNCLPPLVDLLAADSAPSPSPSTSHSAAQSLAQSQVQVQVARVAIDAVRNILAADTQRNRERAAKAKNKEKDKSAPANGSSAKASSSSCSPSRPMDAVSQVVAADGVTLLQRLVHAPCRAHTATAASSPSLSPAPAPASPSSPASAPPSPSAEGTDTASSPAAPSADALRELAATREELSRIAADLLATYFPQAAAQENDACSPSCVQQQAAMKAPAESAHTCMCPHGHAIATGAGISVR